MANIFDIRDEYNVVEKYVAIILFSLLLLNGTITNILMAIVFCCGRNNFFCHSFVLISSQIIICNFLNFIPQVAISTWTHSVFATIDTFSFFAALHFTFLMAVNRFVATNMPKLNVFFESVKLYFLLACVWLFILVISLLEFLHCVKTFDVSNLQWSFNCTKITVESGAIFLKIRYIWTLALPIAMFALYIPIFCSMHRKRNSILDLRRTSGNIGNLLFLTVKENK
ncbi:hypothetical protein X798_05887, partial [Onchocerca flexuosa]